MRCHSHLYFNEESDYFEENACENGSLLLQHRKKPNIFKPQLLIYYIQYQKRKSQLVQMSEAATGGVLRKKVFFKMSQNPQQTPVPGETSVNFAKLLRTLFSQNTSGRLLLKWGHCNNKARDVDCICCRELNAMLYCFGYNPRAQGKHLTIQLLWAYARLLVTRISLIQLIDEFFFWFLVQLNKTKRLYEYKVLSFCFWC